MRQRRNRKVIMYSLMVALFLTTVGYALMKTSLNINGSLTKRGGKWNIYFDNPIVVKEYGDVTLTLPDTFPTNTTTFDFGIRIKKPSDYVTFTVDIVNDGTIDAVLYDWDLSGEDEALAQDIIYTVTYNDGDTIKEGDSLPKKTRRTLKITVAYDEESETLADENVILDFAATLLYRQTVGSEQPIIDNPGIIEGDTSLASAPNLLNNSLTPVVYDETRASWVVADTRSEWYNYSNQQWANAVILNSGVTKNVGDPVVVPTVTSGGEIDATSEVKAMYVWIPRYEYKIEGQYGTHTDGTLGTQDLPGEIKVNFIPQSQTTATPGYILHPAFTWNLSENYDEDGNAIIERDEHLTGIWVGKFEITGTETTPTILPNTKVHGIKIVGSHFRAAEKLGTYLSNTSNTDSHMMKNSEWGAVAYLSQSIYGKYGNSMYTGANKEIYQNKSDSYLTGNSNGTPSQAETLTQCTYDDIIDRGNGTGSCGGGASTTGNIYGVYDMVGGASEYVMGYLTTAVPPSGPINVGNYSGFTEDPAGRYYEAYIINNPLTACNGGVCYGHALSETSGWYSDLAEFATTGDPWFSRGGSYGNGSTVNAGVFLFNNTDTFHEMYFSGVGTRGVLLAPGA